MVAHIHSSSNTSGSGDGAQNCIIVETARPIEILHSDLSKSSIPEGGAVGIIEEEEEEVSSAHDNSTYALPSNSNSSATDVSARTLSQCEDFSGSSPPPPHAEHKTSSRSSQLTRDARPEQYSRSALGTQSNCSSRSSSRIEVSSSPAYRQRDSTPTNATSDMNATVSDASAANASPTSPSSSAIAREHKSNMGASSSSRSGTDDRSERDKRRSTCSSRSALVKAAVAAAEAAIQNRERSNTPWDGLSISEAPFIIDLDEETEVFETAAGR